MLTDSDRVDLIQRRITAPTLPWAELWYFIEKQLDDLLAILIIIGHRIEHPDVPRMIDLLTGMRSDLGLAQSEAEFRQMIGRRIVMDLAPRVGLTVVPQPP